MHFQSINGDYFSLNSTTLTLENPDRFSYAMPLKSLKWVLFFPTFFKHVRVMNIWHKRPLWNGECNYRVDLKNRSIGCQEFTEGIWDNIVRAAEKANW